MDLAYTQAAETFIAELGAEYHAHFAGHRDRFEVDAIYARHADLFAPATIERLRAASAAAAERGGEDAARRLRMLLDFAVEGNLGLATKELAAELAEREASLQLPLRGGALGFRASAVAQANEPDRERRAEIEAARLEATERVLNPLHREALERTRAVVAELGWPSYRALCEELKGLDLDALSRATEAFTAATDGAPYADVLEPVVAATVGVPLAELARADLPWLFRAREADRVFRADQLLPSFEATLRGLGIDVAAQANVELDMEPRAGKSPRAFCVSVRVPQDVRLVVAPVGGRDDYVALLHEGGHLEHYAHVDPALPFEYRHLGDNAVTEAFAFLFDHLAEDPAWLRRRLGVDDAAGGALAAHARATRLVYLRRYCGKLAYELVVHGDAPPGDARLADVYARLLSGAVGVPWPTATYLSDLDPGFYVAAYLRAWALETHLRGWLRERFGETWFERREAGDALRALWRDGQRLSAEELLASLTGAQLDFGVMLRDLGLGSQRCGSVVDVSEAVSPTPTAPLTGACACGVVRFEVRAPFSTAGYCHCRRCQRRTGTTSSLNGRVRTQAFAIVAGADAIRTWQPADGMPKSFCVHCGGHVFSGDRDRHDELGVRLGALDGDPGIRPHWRQWLSSAPAWEAIPDDGLTRHAGSRFDDD